MTLSLPSIIQRGKAFLTPKSSTSSLPQLKDGFTRASTTTSLFPQVDPAVDGEDCDHDCESCHIQYPKGFKIDEDEKLYGHVNGWDTHMLVATGKTDWVKDVQDEKGSVMEAIRECGVEPAHKLMLSASNMPLPQDHDDYPPATAPTTVLLLPAFTFIDNVTPATVPELIHQHINLTLTTTTPLKAPQPLALELETKVYPDSKSPSPEPKAPSSPSAITDTLSSTATRLTTAASSISATVNNALTPSLFTARPCRHRAVILLCSQRTRDARCGQSAPLLLREFNRHLRSLGLDRDLHDERCGGVGIYFISHVGGHKFSANVMIYRRSHPAADEQDGALEEDVNKDGGAFEDGDGVRNGKRRGVIAEELGEGSQCIWLARVRPEDCEGIIKQTVLKGKVVKPERQLRGGFDRGRGLVSW